MALLPWKWLRSLIRRNTTPIPEERAALWKQRLSIAYFIFCWNAFGGVCYMIYKGKEDWMRPYKTEEELAMTPAQHYARTLGIEKTKVYRISGTKVTSYEIRNNEIYREGEEDK